MAVIRFAIVVVACLAAVLGAPDARACSLPPPGVWYYAARASGSQPLNGGVLAMFDSFNDPGDAEPGVPPGLRRHWTPHPP